MNKLGERIRNIRINKSMTQKQLAIKMKIEPTVISHFETGKRKPSSNNLLKLAKALNVSIDTLLDHKVTEEYFKEILQSIEQHEKQLAEVMPDEQTALKIMFSAWERLKMLGFKEAMYCPKDGTLFDAIEAGSTGIHKCYYLGEWPNGEYLMPDGNDLWPSKPILFREIKNDS